MSTSFYIQKIKHYFNFLDFDGSGVIEESDIRQQVKKSAEIRGLSEDSDAYKLASDTLLGLYAALVQMADSNNDGLISKNEFVDFWRNLADRFKNGDKDAYEIMVATTNACASMLDLDNDGSFTWEEYDTWIRGFRKDKYFDTKAAYAVMDIDNDGVIKIENELFQIVKEYWIYDDQTAPGCLFFGSIPGTEVSL